ncbi:MAG: hypothetical protein IJJ26_02130 [Victivallales bacterium]|nr:hypothetical protein [Victivallales bacterium]
MAGAFLRAAPDKEVLLAQVESSPRYTPAEKEALSAQVRSWSRFGVYSVTADEKRACGIGIVEDCSFQEHFKSLLEQKTIAAFGNVFPVWQETFDKIDRTLQVPGRFPTLRNRHVFYAKIGPQAYSMESGTLADGSQLVIIMVDAEKVTVDYARYESEVKESLQKELFLLYKQCRQAGDLSQLRLLDADLRVLGAEVPDSVLHDYLQALQEKDTVVASALLPDLAVLFPELPPALQTALLEAISKSQQKEDCQFLVNQTQKPKDE